VSGKKKVRKENPSSDVSVSNTQIKRIYSDVKLQVSRQLEAGER